VDRFWILALALVVDAIFGDPDFLWRRIPHPVVLAGWLISFLDRSLNRETLPSPRRRLMGVLTLLVIVLVAGAAGWSLEVAFALLPFGWIGTAVVAATMLAGRGLYDQVAAVANALDAIGVQAARAEIAKIVGRDPESLDQSGLARAAIESAAENFSDGLVAPALWFAVLGLPGLLAYKAINTADSMIGHLSARYRDFGWAAARLDDLVNWPAGRLAGALIACSAPLAGGSVGVAFRTMLVDAPKHRSPNAGWPEAAMAGALGLGLAGPRIYAGAVVSDPFLNAAGRMILASSDIRRCLSVYAGAWSGSLAIALAIAAIASQPG
jgi:adenosylcobinamide-phosphate synthase